MNPRSRMCASAPVTGLVSPLLAAASLASTVPDWSPGAATTLVGRIEDDVVSRSPSCSAESLIVTSTLRTLRHPPYQLPRRVFGRVPILRLARVTKRIEDGCELRG